MKTKLPLSGLLIASLLTTYVSADAASTGTAPFSTQQVQQIEQVVHDYLVKHPQVLVEASQALRDQMQEGQEKAAVGAIKTNAKALFNDANSPTVGSAEASVTLVEFFDYQCGHCKEMTDAVDSLIKQNKNLRVVFKELPIFGADSEYAAKAALAAQKQDKFFAFHNALMKAANPLNNDKVMEVAKSVGLDTSQLSKDMESASIQQELKNNVQLAQAMQLMGTPAFVFANRAGTQFGFIPGAASQKDLEVQINKLK